jgi:hypothetical protein
MTAGPLLRQKFARQVVMLMSETNFNSGPLHTLNPLGRFSDRAADYVKYRPTYPAVAIDTKVPQPRSQRLSTGLISTLEREIPV